MTHHDISFCCAEIINNTSVQVDFGQVKQRVVDVVALRVVNTDKLVWIKAHDLRSVYNIQIITKFGTDVQIDPRIIHEQKKPRSVRDEIELRTKI